MKTFYECLPCFVNQALGLLKRSGASAQQTERAMRGVFHELAAVKFTDTPPVTGNKINRIIRSTLDTADPYEAEKRRFNDFALELLPQMQGRTGAGRDVFVCAIKLAIAANIIDSGKNSALTEHEVLACFDAALDTPVDEDAVSRLREAVGAAGSILYLCDNAGEIVFDRYLIEQMPRRKVTCAVRGAPVINDATIEDARYTGLDDFARVISNGSDAPGTVLQECSPEFTRAFDEADLIIAKGQGNFETLSDVKNKRIFFLLQVKCPVIARDIGFAVGAFVVKEKQSPPDN
jgi:uncharacterized protein with ATP-grasp and redox domains